MNEWDFVQDLIRQLVKKCDRFSEDGYYDDTQKAAWVRLGDKLRDATEVTVRIPATTGGPF